MNETRFQQLLSASPPHILAAHEGKLFSEFFIQMITHLSTFHFYQSLENFVKLLKLALLGAPKAYSLTVTKEGFKIFDPRPLLGFTFMWSEVSKFTPGNNHIIYFDTKLFGKNKIFYNIYAISTPQLARLLNHWREQAIQNG